MPRWPLPTRRRVTPEPPTRRSAVAPPGSPDYVRTDDVRATLGLQAVRGGAITIACHAPRLALALLTTAVLGRLLTPHDYGLVNMAATLIGFVALFKDPGLGTATIQSEELTTPQVTTLFWLNVGLGIVLMLLTIALAPGMAWVFNEPRLTGVTATYAVVFVFDGLAVQHEALLRRRMRFTALSGINLTTFAIQAGVTIALAWSGFGYWALVYGHLASSICRAIGAWTLCGWRPDWPGRLAEVRGHLDYGRHITGFTVANYFARNLDNLLIAQVWGPAQLGLYARAYQLLLLPLDWILEPVTSVAIPTLSRLNGTPARYREAYVRLLEGIAIATMPLMAFMTVMADSIVLVLLGPRWIDAIPVFSILGVVGIVQPVMSTTGWLFITQGRARELFRWGLVGSSLLIAFIVIGLPWGVIGVAASYSAGFLGVVSPTLLWYVGRAGHVRTADIYGAIAPVICAALMTGGTLLVFRFAIGPVHPIAGLVGGLGITTVITLLFFMLIPTGRRVLHHLKLSLSLLVSTAARQS